MWVMQLHVICIIAPTGSTLLIMLGYEDPWKRNH